jgi:Zn-dependent peptidase ImmA (M78 family)
VKYVKDTTGRFKERPHYEPAELDRECEIIIKKHLKSLHGEIRFPVETDDLTKLIELESQSLDLYADLTEFGSEVEGVTEFRPGDKPLVYINKELGEDSKRENRLRTTLTHEYGHVHYHSYLWNMDIGQMHLSEGNRDTRAICKRATILESAQYDWMEWQAGHVCGAILMPASYVRECAMHYVDEKNAYGPFSPDSEYGINLIGIVSQQFQVSKEAAKIRLLRLAVLSNTTNAPSLFSS